MESRPELLDYIAFFEAEPKDVAAQGWYHGAEVESHRGEDRISAYIAPDDGVFAFKWWQGTKLRTDIHLSAVTGWTLACQPGKEVLRLEFHTGIPYLVVQLKPYVSVGWITAWT